MNRDDQSGGVRWTGIARQALLPGETQERRQCARSARVKIFSAGIVASDGESGEELSRQMVWLRTTFSQVRRMPQRGQSRQSTGAEGRRAGAESGGGEESA